MQIVCKRLFTDNRDTNELPDYARQILADSGVDPNQEEKTIWLSYGFLMSEIG